MLKKLGFLFPVPSAVVQIPAALLPAGLAHQGLIKPLSGESRPSADLAQHVSRQPWVCSAYSALGERTLQGVGSVAMQRLQCGQVVKLSNAGSSCVGKEIQVKERDSEQGKTSEHNSLILIYEILKCDDNTFQAAS